ncbi:MAG: molybdate ABC transporter substrate-binding protein [Paracoccaceae bacterium]
MPLWLVSLLLCWCFAGAALAGDILIAVASNFTKTAETLRQSFAAETGNTASLASGSTGKLQAQIAAGAPYDILLSADDAAASALAALGLAEDNSRFVYAEGRLALVGPVAGSGDDTPIDRLKAGDYRHIAIANPALAPYGRAARETLEALLLWPEAQPRIVTGENVAQALSLVLSGAAELGLVAAPGLSPGALRIWPVPEALHTPVRQEAVLLAHGADNAAARAFLDWLRGDAARGMIVAAGYGVPAQ